MIFTASTSTHYLLSRVCTDNSTSDSSNVRANATSSSADIYQTSSLSNALIEDIQDGILDQVRLHCSTRQTLLDAVVYDVTEK